MMLLITEINIDRIMLEGQGVFKKNDTKILDKEAQSKLSRLNKTKISFQYVVIKQEIPLL